MMRKSVLILSVSLLAGVALCPSSSQAGFDRTSDEGATPRANSAVRQAGVGASNEGATPTGVNALCPSSSQAWFSLSSDEGETPSEFNIKTCTVQTLLGQMLHSSRFHATFGLEKDSKRYQLEVDGTGGFHDNMSDVRNAAPVPDLTFRKIGRGIFDFYWLDPIDSTFADKNGNEGPYPGPSATFWGKITHLPQRPALEANQTADNRLQSLERPTETADNRTATEEEGARLLGWAPNTNRVNIT